MKSLVPELYHLEMMVRKPIQIKSYYIAKIDDSYRGPKAQFRLSEQVAESHRRRIWKEVITHSGLCDQSGKHGIEALFHQEELLDKLADEDFIEGWRSVSAVDSINNTLTESQHDFLKSTCDILWESDSNRFYCFNDSILAGLSVSPGCILLTYPKIVGHSNFTLRIGRSLFSRPCVKQAMGNLTIKKMAHLID